MYVVLRLVLLICVSLWLAFIINHKNYDYVLNKTLLSIHTNLKTSKLTSVLPEAVESLLIHNQRGPLQELLDRNYSIFALVITDCRTDSLYCPDQKVLMTTSPNLLVRKLPAPVNLVNYPFVMLRLPVPSAAGPGSQSRPVIGRLYTISTMPASFAEDYREWLKDPFGDYSLWQTYLTTTVNSLIAALLVWVILELFLKIKLIQGRAALERERILIANADKYLRQMEDKETQIAEQEKTSDAQFEVLIGRIRELEATLRHDREQQRAAEAIIQSIEQERQAQVAQFREQLEQTAREKAALLSEVTRYRSASGKEKEEASRTLTNAISTPFENALEREIRETLAASAKGRSGAWRVLHQVDVAVGKEVSRFIDSVVISKDCITVIEAKNYSGRIFADGDAENTGWHCQPGNRAAVAIKASWGVNPYHQVREYVMTLMTVVNTRGSWRLPVYGVIVFPGGADLSGIGERLGKFYRVTSSDRLIATLDNIEAEARRENAHTIRPQPLQVEALVLGRKMVK
ncbi:nuclease-related domain-containing protein [Geomonas oryzae]|uniref:nuclease-related domain-containing protein n=1 Tax=Geomonas oryzae TaxID=2364273 RepID=UPI0013A5EFF3|nr:NERD domain-containing protein [Geomonas oryzae]